MLSKISGYIVYCIFKLLGIIPLTARTRLGFLIGYIIGAFPSKALKIAELQIKLCLKSKDSKKVARLTFAQAGSTSFECLDLSAMIKNPDRYFELKNPAELESILARNKGVVALTAHFANFDAMGAYFASRNINIMAVAKQLRNPSLQFALKRLRESFGFTTLWRADKSGIKKIIEALKNRWTVASLIDHDTRVSSLMAPFFGLPASTPKTLVELAKKTDSTIVSAFVVRKKGTKFEIIIQELDSSLSNQDLLSEFNKRLEKVIAEYPEQWAWMHKRWRTINGQRLGGNEYLKYLKEISLIL